jgi:hypothetical protein
MRFGVQNRSGQAMLIATLALGGAILGATAIAGYLTAYQIRATTDFANSAKAIFAADAGTEWALYDYFVDSSTPMVAMGNGASVSVSCADVAGDTVSCGDPTAVQAVSDGSAADAERAFFLSFGGATSTAP